MAKRENNARSGEAYGSENLRIHIDEVIQKFLNDPEQRQFDFPADYPKPMREYIHHECERFGLMSKSHGREPNRILSIYKSNLTKTCEEISLQLSSETHKILCEVHPMDVTKDVEYKRNKHQCDSAPKAYQSDVAVRPPVSNPFKKFRESLPIYHKKQVILDTIRSNQVTVISAETGSGKTTQIPQFIIEEAAEMNGSVRVICTQPRRLSTVAVSKRVAAERGEQVGQTIGYHIKLEQKLGPDTAVIYCTNGLLIRTLLSGEDCFKHLTHIFVDEIHERDKYTDFLMIHLREAIRKFPRLRLVLMSATMDMDPFVEYFDKNAAVLCVEGRSFSCTSFFLEDVLKQINYKSQKMCTQNASNAVAEADEASKREADCIMARCFDRGGANDFQKLIRLYQDESISPNHQDEHGRTVLMAAAKHGNFRFVGKLLKMGASASVASAEGLTAVEWAERAHKIPVVRMLQSYRQRNHRAEEHDASEGGILADYQRTVNDKYIDNDLILAVIEHVHYNLGDLDDGAGAILVFLPGYEEIVACHERIASSSMNPNEYKVFMLHGSMQVQAQHGVLQRIAGKRKIILATNIAETSITIDDVRFVVDAGKAKIKNYDARTGISSLNSEWIAMANSRQRAGRAGRTQDGCCFHLYSIARYESFLVNPVPEILRTPLHELCLQTKLLAPASMCIAEFLHLAIDPPKEFAVQEAIASLKCLGALDESETLTPLGEQLVQLSVEPRLGKMLIYAVILKCLDPVLTIVTSMSLKDPFMLPSEPHLKKLASDKRKSMAGDSLSDHMIFVRAYQLWEEQNAQNRGYRFCNQNFINPAAMELISKTKSQLLGQLRTLGFVRSNPSEDFGELNAHSSNWGVAKCCLAAGLFPNVAIYNERKLHTKLQNVFVDKLSCVSGTVFCDNNDTLIKRAWLFFGEITKCRHRSAVNSCTIISPLTVALVCGQNAQATDKCLLLDDAYEFLIDSKQVNALRSNVQHVFFKRINAPQSRLNDEETDTIQLLARVLDSEESHYGLGATGCGGTRPRTNDFAFKRKHRWGNGPRHGPPYKHRNKQHY